MLVVVAGLAAAGGGWYVLRQFEQPGPTVTDGSVETIVQLPMGTGLNLIALQLFRQGAITNPLIFRLGVMYYGKQSALKAGEYAIPSGATPHQIMDILESGKSIVHKLTVAEGLTSAMVLDLVRNDRVLVGELPAVPDEGSLLPETYLYDRGTTRAQLIARMQADHNKVLDSLWEKRAAGLPFSTKNEAVTLASIVEKETGVASERPRVAAVFMNRLRKGMKLQSDPTIIYGITKGVPLGRGIRQSELTGATPYNTYVIQGLPPTPIANPGRASLEAVLNPPQTDELFFVADGTGGHAFAATEAEHNKNVQKWREIERQRSAQNGAH